MTPDVKVVTSRAILKETPMMMVGIRVIIWTRVMMSLDGFVDNHNEDDDDGDGDDDGGGGDGDSVSMLHVKMIISGWHCLSCKQGCSFVRVHEDGDVDSEDGIFSVMVLDDECQGN